MFIYMKHPEHNIVSKRESKINKKPDDDVFSKPGTKGLVSVYAHAHSFPCTSSDQVRKLYNLGVHREVFIYRQV